MTTARHGRPREVAPVLATSSRLREVRGARAPGPQNLPARKSAIASWICSGVFITNGP